jgi:hypothetical protein
MNEAQLHVSVKKRRSLQIITKDAWQVFQKFGMTCTGSEKTEKEPEYLL